MSGAAGLPWRLERGAALLYEGGVRFSVWAPRARRVAVRFGDGSSFREAPLEETGEGVFEASIGEAHAGHDYRFRLDGERERPDPVSRCQPEGVHGPSRIVDPAFPWSDESWIGLDMADLAIYELHVGTFTKGGTFDSVIEHVPYLVELGVTAIELMPVAAFPGRWNWGYDGVAPYAPQESYGGPRALKRLIDAAHAAGLAVILDVVYNHLGPEGNYLSEFGPYFTDRHHTPWGPALNFDDAESDEVRRYFVDNALYWITEYHVDGLRLDAVHAIYDFGAVHILDEIAGRLHAEAARLGRKALVIAESDLNDPRLVRRRERGGYGLDGQWSDDFHHAVHAALTGERSGYYVDFGGHEPVAEALRNRFVIAGRRSRFRRRRHGAPASDVPADRFVVFVQNHDQVGNRARGERLSTLVPPESARLAAALLLLSPYVPLLFMGEEYGETNPFLYFVSHGDPELVEAVREGRRREFESFGWGAEIPDPQAEETFAASRLDWSKPEAPGHLETLTLYRECLELRQEEPALRPGAATVRVVSSGDDGGWIALELDHPERPLLAVFSFAAEPRRVRLAARGREWTLRLSTEETRFGGSGTAASVDGVPDDEIVLAVPPRSAVLCRAAPRGAPASRPVEGAP